MNVEGQSGWSDIDEGLYNDRQRGEASPIRSGGFLQSWGATVGVRSRSHAERTALVTES